MGLIALTEQTLGSVIININTYVRTAYFKHITQSNSIAMSDKLFMVHGKRK